MRSPDSFWMKIPQKVPAGADVTTFSPADVETTPSLGSGQANSWISSVGEDVGATMGASVGDLDGLDVGFFDGWEKWNRNEYEMKM